MSATTVLYNVKKSKWDVLVDGKVTNTVSTKEKAERILRNMGYDSFAVAPISTVQKAEKEFSINERFDFLSHFVKMVARKQSHALFISGPGGLGKTHTVLETLAKAGKREMAIGDYDGDYVIIKGFTTAKGMYRTLYENNGKIIIFDDADSSFKDVIGINILKGALDSNDKRIISWNAEFPEKEDLPNRFEFIGSVIFISNMTMEKVPQALVSRCMKVSLDMDAQEKVDRIAHVMFEPNFCGSVDRSMKQEVLDFITQNAERFNDLNIRAALNLVKIRNSMDYDEVEKFQKIALYTSIS